MSTDPVAFDVPTDALQTATASQNITNSTRCNVAQTQFIVYRTSSFFQDVSMDSSTTQVASSVVSAQVGDLDAISLAEPSSMSFQLNVTNATVRMTE